MFITPIQMIGSIGSIDELKTKNEISSFAANGNQNFQNIFSNLIDNVVQTEDKKTQTQYLLNTGQLDDAHTLPIEGTRAQLSVDLLVQLRNKAMDSYNELMRINL